MWIFVLKIQRTIICRYFIYDSTALTVNSRRNRAFIRNSSTIHDILWRLSNVSLHSADWKPLPVQETQRKCACCRSKEHKLNQPLNVSITIRTLLTYFATPYLVIGRVLKRKLFIEKFSICTKVKDLKPTSIQNIIVLLYQCVFYQYISCCLSFCIYENSFFSQ